MTPHCADSAKTMAPRGDETVEALMYSLRRGVAALSEPDCQRRLADLNDDQMREVAIRLQEIKN